MHNLPMDGDGESRLDAQKGRRMFCLAGDT